MPEQLVEHAEGVQVDPGVEFRRRVEARMREAYLAREAESASSPAKAYAVKNWRGLAIFFSLGALTCLAVKVLWGR